MLAAFFQDGTGAMDHEWGMNTPLRLPQQISFHWLGHEMANTG